MAEYNEIIDAIGAAGDAQLDPRLQRGATTRQSGENTAGDVPSANRNRQKLSF